MMRSRVFFLLLLAVSFLGMQVGWAQQNYRTRAVGSWTTPAVWERQVGSVWSIATDYPGQFLNNAATITIRHAVTVNGDPQTINGNVVVERGASLVTSGIRTLDIAGDVSLEGAALLGGSTFTFSGNLHISGSLNIDFYSLFTFSVGTLTVDGNTTVGVGAVLTNNGTMSSGGTVSVDRLISVGEFRNNGVVTLTRTGAGTISGGGDWIQGANSTLNYSGSTLTVSGFSASASGNSVVYNSANQTVRTPDGAYYHLILAGSGTKSYNAAVDINGNLIIRNTTTFNPGNNSIDVEGNVSLEDSGTLSGTGNIAVGGDWYAASASSFSEGTRTVAFDGNSAQTLSSPDGETFYRLTLNNSSAVIPQLDFIDPVVVTNTLSMQSGVVNLNGNTFTLGASGVASTLTRTASTTTNWMYNGTFSRGWIVANITSNSGSNYGLFPLGHSEESSYRHVFLSSGTTVATRPATGAMVSVTHIHNDGVVDLATPFLSEGAAELKRKHNAQFIVAVNGVTGGTYRITVRMTGLDNGTAGNVRLAADDGNDRVKLVGVHVANSSTAATPIVARSGITDLSELNNDFRIVSTNPNATPLPVELADFNARLDNNSVSVSWSTASELNNDYFTVERAVDLEQFDALATVSGAGTTSTPKYYLFTDVQPLYGRCYYRLRQTDFDGKYTYSNVVTINYDGPKVPSLSVYPNPAKGTTVTIQLEGFKNQLNIPIQIVNANGKVVYEKVLEVQSPGVFQRQIQFLAPLNKGIYFVRAGQTLSLLEKLVVN